MESVTVQYLGMQSGGVLSISHAPKSFILTGLLDHIVEGFMFDLSVIAGGGGYATDGQMDLPNGSLREDGRRKRERESRG